MIWLGSRKKPTHEEEEYADVLRRRHEREWEQMDMTLAKQMDFILSEISKNFPHTKEGEVARMLESTESNLRAAKGSVRIIFEEKKRYLSDKHQRELSLLKKKIDDLLSHTELLKEALKKINQKKSENIHATKRTD